MRLSTSHRPLRRRLVAAAISLTGLAGAVAAESRFPTLDAAAEGQGSFENRGNGERFDIERATVHLRASGEVDIRLQGRRFDLRVEARMRNWNGRKHVEFDVYRFDGQPSNAFGWVNLDQRGGFERIEISGKEPIRLSVDFFTKRSVEVPPPSPVPGPIPAPNPLPFTEEWGFDRPGYDYRDLRVDSVGACQAECARDSRCLAYTFNQSSRVCYLKHTATAPRPRRDTVSGERRFAADGPRGLTQQFGADQPGGDYVDFRSSDLAQCQRSCAEDPRCRAYTFNSSDARCYLKDRPGTIRLRADCVTGVKAD